MKALKGTLFAIALMLALAGRAHAQTPISVGVASCGTSYNYCYTVPMTIGGVQGTAWIDSPNFILFRAPLQNANNPATLTITSVSGVVYQNGYILQETLSFSGPADPNNDADTDTVTGQITLNFSHAVSGRYTTYKIIGGSGSQSITQD